MKYSIIIPHYNSPDLLERLLNSIPTRIDTEVIVVDDNSSKDVQTILKDWDNQFKNVRFIFSETNGGGGKARNIGIENSFGKYLIFADSDDFFLPSFNKILDEYVDSDEDLIIFNAISLNSDTYYYEKRSRQLNNLINRYSKNKSNKNSLIYIKYLFGEPWCKIIRRELVDTQNIRFDEISIHNDTKFSYLVGHFAKNISINPICAYCVTERTHSVSKSIGTDKILTRAKVFYEKNKFLELNNIKIVDRIFFSPLWIALKSFDSNLLFSIISKAKIKPTDIIKYFFKYLFQK